MLAELNGYGVRLKPVEEQHLAQLRQWRNSPYVREQMVSSDIISVAQQNAWFASIQSRMDQQHFVIEYRGECIGAANLKSEGGTSIAKTKILEPGLYIGNQQYRSNILAFAPSLLLIDYCFEQLQVAKLQAKVKSSNTAALNYNHKLGYREVDKERCYVIIVLEKAQYESSTATLKNLLSRQRK